SPSSDGANHSDLRRHRRCPLCPPSDGSYHTSGSDPCEARSADVRRVADGEDPVVAEPRSRPGATRSTRRGAPDSTTRRPLGRGRRVMHPAADGTAGQSIPGPLEVGPGRDRAPVTTGSRPGSPSGRGHAHALVLGGDDAGGVLPPVLVDLEAERTGEVVAGDVGPGEVHEGV